MKKQTNEKILQFFIQVDQREIPVKAKPYEANGQKRFRVSVNGSPIHIIGSRHAEHGGHLDLSVLESSAAEPIAPAVAVAVIEELTSILSAMKAA